MDLTIRNENESDYRIVEELTRGAFWNVHVPGCVEHFVLHNLRISADFIPKLDFVAEKEGQIVGNIVYRQGILKHEHGKETKVISFGPVSVLPKLQKQGIGSDLINHTIKGAKKIGYPAIFIYGDPRYYSRFGFRCTEKWDIKTAFDKFAVALMALELKPCALSNKAGKFIESAALGVDDNKFEEFDKSFPYKEKKETESQRDFRILASLMY
jgi:putative acetyltransferase